MNDLPERVRSHCASIAASAEHVEIDAAASFEPGGRSGLDPQVHHVGGSPAQSAAYVLVMDAINFGSGWFEMLAQAAGEDPTTRMSRRLTEHARLRDGDTWEPAELRAMPQVEVAYVLGLETEHPLTTLYTDALRQLGAWLGDRTALDAVSAAGGSAAAFAESLTSMPFFDDPGFYKRAQITANDLVLAGAADFEDVDRLTIFADNLVPHVLRTDGVLRYSGKLASIVDAGVELPAGSRMEAEIRGCAVHACERIAADFGVAPRTLDNWLWNRGLEPRYQRGRPHQTRTVFY